MSSNTKRLMRKQKQAARREVRAQAEEMRERIAQDLKTFESYLRPKPKWIPTPVWRWGMRIFIKM